MRVLYKFYNLAKIKLITVDSSLLATTIYQRYLFCRKLDIKAGKMADICALITKEASNNTQNIKQFQNCNRS